MQRLQERSDLEWLTDRALQAQLTRLLDLALRAIAAELAVSASASASYRKIELLLARHLGGEAAGRWSERVTRGGVAVTPRHAASAAVFAGPTWAELDIEPVVVPHHDGERRQVVLDLLTELRTLPSWGQEGLRQALRSRALTQIIDETTVLLHRREACKAAILWIGGEVRRVLLEFGRRLRSAGVLETAEDIELLSLAEVHHALDGRPVSAQELAARARWNARYLAEPPLSALFVGTPAAEAVRDPDAERLEGWAASGGTHTAAAQVVVGHKDRFDDGNVLVAAATDASWSPLFIRAGAIVVERGGPLSHAAILARELGVPAVLNVSDATRVLDGRIVTVDGDRGIVFVHEDGDES